MKALLFDMDGVLVDVRQSYLLTIKKTCAHFTGGQATDAEIRQLRNKGGFNNDWDITETLITQKMKRVPKKDIINTFQELYKGTNFNGLIQNETWLLDTAVLKQLHKQYRLAIVTGRPRPETEYTLAKTDTKKFFNAVITMDDTREQKPHPIPLKTALQSITCTDGWYVGDMVDDMIMAKKAGIIPIGVIPPGEDRCLKKTLIDHGAVAVIDDINKIQDALV